MDERDIFVESMGDIEEAVNRIVGGTIILEPGGLYLGPLRLPAKARPCVILTEGYTRGHSPEGVPRAKVVTPKGYTGRYVVEGASWGVVGLSFTRMEFYAYDYFYRQCYHDGERDGVWEQKLDPVAYEELRLLCETRGLHLTGGAI
jgi:hypothetical protein